jgi:hypothetical protein
VAPGAASLVQLKVHDARRSLRRQTRTIDFEVEAQRQGLPPATAPLALVQSPTISGAAIAKVLAVAAVLGGLALAWFGLVAPAGTPTERVERLRNEAAKALQDPALAARLDALGGSLVLSSPAAFQALIASELPRWRVLVKELGIQAD